MDQAFDNYSWLNPSQTYRISGDEVFFATKPGTDYWQRTHYGFRRDNGHQFAFLTSREAFIYGLKTRYTPHTEYDQAGVMVYIDPDNWCKASIEFENEAVSRLGSVVTNSGFSDWATTDIQTQPKVEIFYRLSRQGKDFLLEQSSDDHIYHQMRIFHLMNADSAIRVGMYACSPQQSSFEVRFSQIRFGACTWPLVHASEE